MCGIFSIYNHQGIVQDSNKYISSLRTLKHRGPDDEGSFINDKIFIGHRRLSILDLSDAGHQPMLNKEKNVVLAFNGQIYNHLELRDALIDKGYMFQSKCDTETVLNMYLEYGLDAFEKLCGMWAIVIWDHRTESLVVSRDRFGIKPLFFYNNNNNLYLASEIKAILKADACSKSINEASFQRYVKRGWLDHNCETMFSNVHSVEPASILVWQKGKLIVDKKYWVPPVPSRDKSDPDEIRETFIDIVRQNLQSDVPVATTLSGGLDSSSITCVLAKELGQVDSVHAFSVVPPDTADESAWINDTLKWTGISHTYFKPEKVDFISSLDDMIIRMDEPVFNSSYVYQSLLRKEVKENGNKVLLVGDGGDEFFSGYAKLMPMFISSLISQGNFQAAKNAIRGAVKFTGKNIKEQFNRLRLFKESTVGSRSYQEFRRAYDFFNPETDMSDKQLFPDETYPQLDQVSNGRPLFKELLERIRIDIPHHLRNEDRNSMAYGIEARPVFIDHRLLELVWRYPYEEFMKNGINKQLLRTAMKGIVTPSVLDLKKKFVRPGNNTLVAYDILKEPIQDVLNSSTVKLSSQWQKNIASLFVNDCESRNADNAYPWFRFYMAMRWMDLKINQSTLLKETYA